MKTALTFLWLALALLLVLAAPTGLRAQDDDSSASFQTFYDQLGSQGNWVQTDDYGYAWQPSGVDSDWQPYSNGHWIYTDAGWTWDSAEPWGWATYHYGRWVNLDGQGWVWIPGYTWAPAWVSWRYGGGYCGWAPLPPETSVGIDFGGVSIGFHIGGDCDTAFGIGAGCYRFCPVGYLGARDYRPYYVNRFNNYGIINRTTNVTNINVTNNYNGRNRFGRVNAGGPVFNTINAQSRTPIQRATLAEARGPGQGRLNGRSFAVYAPRINSANSAAERPSRVERKLDKVAVNRGTDINRPLLARQGVTLAQPTPQQVKAAREAQSRAPRQAKIADEKNVPARPLTKPLTSYQPRAEHKGADRPGTASSVAAPGNLGQPAEVAGKKDKNPKFEKSRPAAATAPALATPAAATPPRHEPTAQSQAPVKKHAAVKAPTPVTQGAQATHKEKRTAIASPAAPPTHERKAAPRPAAPAYHAPAPVHHPAAVPHVSAPRSTAQPHNAPHAGNGGGGGGHKGAAEKKK